MEKPIYHGKLSFTMVKNAQVWLNEIVIFVRKHSYVRALYFAEKHDDDILRSICSISIVDLFQRLNRPHWGSDDIWRHKIVYLLFRTIWSLARAFKRKKSLFCLLTICTVQGLCAIQQQATKLPLYICMQNEVSSLKDKIVPRTELLWITQT